MADDAPATTVLLYDAAAVGSYPRGRRPLYKATHNAVILEMIPQGAGAVASLTVVDSADAVSGYESSIDGEAQQAGVAQYTKVILTRLLPYVDAQLTVTAGTWTVKATAINIPNSEVVTVSGTINQGNAGAQPWPVTAAGTVNIGNVPPSPSALFDGTLTAGAAAAALPSHACAAVLVQNDPTNATDIDVGSATSQSVRLQPGQSEVFTVNNSGLISVTAVSGTPRVNWHAA